MKTNTCPICSGRRWLVMATNGDDSRTWIERCDECSTNSLDDVDAAELAAAACGGTIAYATPAGLDHEHPYVVPAPCALCERPMGPGDDQQTQMPGRPYCGDCWHARDDDGAYLFDLDDDDSPARRLERAMNDDRS